MLKMKRIFDLVVAIILLMFLSIPLLFIALLIKLTSRGPVLHWSDRIGGLSSACVCGKIRLSNLFSLAAYMVRTQILLT
jgi:O-antigen biosynthesis protein WbqP